MGQRGVPPQVFERLKYGTRKAPFWQRKGSFVRKPITVSHPLILSEQTVILYFLILLSTNYRDFNYCSLYQTLSKGLFIVSGGSKLGSLGYNDRHEVASDSIPFMHPPSSNLQGFKVQKKILTKI